MKFLNIMIIFCFILIGCGKKSNINDSQNEAFKKEEVTTSPFTEEGLNLKICADKYKEVRMIGINEVNQVNFGKILRSCLNVKQVDLTTVDKIYLKFELNAANAPVDFNQLVKEI